MDPNGLSFPSLLCPKSLLSLGVNLFKNLFDRTLSSQGVLKSSDVSNLLKSIAPEIMEPEYDQDKDALDSVNKKIIQDIEWKRDKSPFYKRFLLKLSQVRKLKAPINVV